MFIAHVRAATSTSIQRTNCHPFRYGRWLFVHNGLIRNFRSIRRELALAIGEDLYAELMEPPTRRSCSCCPAFGMDDDVYGGVARMVGFVEDLDDNTTSRFPVQMTLGIADGDRLVCISVFIGTQLQEPVCFRERRRAQAPGFG